MDKKNLIYMHAIEIISKEGFANTTVQKIADSAEISVGTIYNYFKSKEEILNYIFQVEYEKRNYVLKAMSDPDKEIDEKLKAFLDCHFNEITDNNSAVRTIVQEGISHYIDKIEWIHKSVMETDTIFKLMLEQAIEREEIRNVDAAIVGSCIKSIATNMFLIARQKDSKDEVEEVKEELLRFFLKGLAKD